MRFVSNRQAIILSENNQQAPVWPYFAVAAVGGFLIVVGNAMRAFGGPSDTGGGHVLRQLGLTVCIIVGIVFILVRNVGRIHDATTRLRSVAQSRSRKPGLLYGSVGPSPFVVTAVRVYAVLLILCGLYMVLVSTGQMLAMGFGPAVGWPFFYLLLNIGLAIITIVPGFLIWNLIGAIVQMDEKLEDVVREVEELKASLRR